MKKKDLRIITEYMRRVYHVNKFQLMVKEAIKKVRLFRKKHPFDAIAFTGMSGSALAYCLSYSLGIPLLAIRKPRDQAHYRVTSGKVVEGCIGATTFLIVDDFIDSGRTIARIMKALPKNSKVVGICLYDEHECISCLRDVIGIKKMPIIKV